MMRYLLHSLTDDETVLSPIASVQSDESQHLDVPFVISLPHCAGDDLDQWSFSVYSQHVNDTSQWQVGGVYACVIVYRSI